MTQEELQTKLNELETQIQTLKKQGDELQSQAQQLQFDFNQQQVLKYIGDEKQWNNQFIKINVKNDNAFIHEKTFIAYIVAHCKNVKVEKQSIRFNFNENYLESDNLGIRLYTEENFFIINTFRDIVNIQKITQQQYDDIIKQHKQYLNNIEQL